MASGFCSVRGLWPGAGSVAAAVRCRSSCPAWAAGGRPGGLWLLMGVYSSRAGAGGVLRASWAAWVWRMALWLGVRCRGAVGAVAGRGAVLLSIVAAGCPHAVWVVGEVFTVGVGVGVGGPAAVGVLFLFGTLPQLHSRVSGGLEGVWRR